ncbi:MAG: NAD-dependent epimerase/dehydratase family protein, partial [Solirubrobacterales bacterium]
MNSPAATTVLVVGATGFIGRHAAERLAETGFKVLGTSRDGKHSDFPCDLLDPASVEYVIDRVRPDAILVAAGKASVVTGWKDPEGAFLTNTTGPFNLLEAVRRQAPAIHVTLVSSAAVYGMPESREDLPFTEASPTRPASPYGASKAAAEVLTAQYGRGFGIAVAVARVFNQIGPGQSDAQAPAEFAREIAKA